MKLTERIKRIPAENKKTALFLLFIALYFTAWACVQPFDASPDEAMRYDVAKYIYNHGALPRGDDPEILDEKWGISYAFNPILSYMFAAVAMKVMSFFSANPFHLVMAARMVSVLFGVGTIFFAILIARRLFDKRSGTLFVLLLAFIPNMAFLSSYVNTDAFGIFCTAFIVYVWTRVLTEDWTWKNCFLLGAAIGLCALSYYNSYGFVLCSILLFCATILLGEGKKWDFKKLFSRGLVISAVVLSICGWWFVRNFILYDGDFLARDAQTECAEVHAQEEYKPSAHDTPKRRGMTPLEMILDTDAYEFSWPDMVSRSFIGVFSYMVLMAPLWYYHVWRIFLLAGFLAAFLRPRLFSLKKERRVSGWFHWAMLAALLIPNLLNVYYSYASDYQPQGRYSFPMVIPLMYFVTTGYENLTRGMSGRIWNRERVFSFFGCAAALLGIFSFAGVFLPFYSPVLAELWIG